MWFLIIPLVLLVIDWFAAKQFDEIARMKGHTNSKYFWWCFWLGVFGWAMVIALPDRGAAQIKAPSNELPEL
jgi:hypothetical protein